MDFRAGAGHANICHTMSVHRLNYLILVHPWWGLTYVGSIVLNSEIYHRGQVFCFHFFLRLVGYLSTRF
jgi:hypothetical protein